MAGQYSMGVASFKIAPVAVDGGMGTVLSSPGDVRENTIKLTPQAPTRTDIKAEGKTDPVISVSQKGVKDLAFDLLTLSIETLQDLAGGTLTGVAPNQFWNEPSTAPLIERSVEIVDLQGYTWRFPRVQITASLVGAFTSTEPNVLRIAGVVLTPTKAGVGSVQYGKSA